MRRRITVFVVLLVAFTVVFSSITFYLLSPRASQQFIGFGVFSDQGTLGSYLPGSGFLVPANQWINWTFQVANRMGAVQFVRIVFRIANQSTPSPSETSPADSNPAIGMVERFVANGVNESIRFDWKLDSVTTAGGLVFPVIRLGNGTQIVSTVGTPTGRDFRFIFELWTFDKGSNDFRYGWSSGGISYANWLQVWFDTV